MTNDFLGPCMDFITCHNDAIAWLRTCAPCTSHACYYLQPTVVILGGAKTALSLPPGASSIPLGILVIPYSPYCALNILLLLSIGHLLVLTPTHLLREQLFIQKHIALTFSQNPLLSVVCTWSDNFEHNSSNWAISEKHLKRDCLTNHEKQLSVENFLYYCSRIEIVPYIYVFTQSFERVKTYTEAHLAVYNKNPLMLHEK